jgi:hypothetical protein
MLPLVHNADMGDPVVIVPCAWLQQVALLQQMLVEFAKIPHETLMEVNNGHCYLNICSLFFQLFMC